MTTETTTRRVLTSEQKNSIVSLYQGGTAISAIAREHDIPASSVRVLLKNQGVLHVKPNSKAGRKRMRGVISSDVISQAITMATSGNTLTNISRLLNVNPTELSASLASQGITFTRGRPKATV